MLHSEQADLIAKKETFFATGRLSTSMAPLISESWQRSREFGIDPFSASLPDINNRDVLTSFITQINIRDSYFYNAEAAFLDSIGAAIVFANEHLDVFAIRGSRELKDRLRLINFRFGTNLAESRVGTNALAISYQTEKEAWVYGNEHYLSILSDYVCVASCGVYTPDRDYFPCMIIMPIEKFTEHHKLIFSYILSTHLYRQNSIMNSNYLIYNAMINYLIGNREIFCISIDTQNKIIDVSDNLLEHFQMKFTLTVGHELKVIFPALGDIIDSDTISAKPERVVLQYLSTPPEAFYLKRFPVTGYETVLGSILILSADPTFFSGITGDTKHLLQATKSVERLISTNSTDFYSARFTFEDIIGQDPSILSTIHQARMVSTSRSDVLITGESGTGKELFAQAIHNASNRSTSAFVFLNCASIPKELIDSELFGYVEGAFPGVRKLGAPGKIEMANGGTLFLDEIGDLPLDLQIHLLRVLEDRTVTRLGDTKRRYVDVRIIASSNRDLKQLVEDEKFRTDLYYRLNVFSLDVPPLRERLNDIPLLSGYFLKQYAASFNKIVTDISPDAMSALMAYSWPGNIRELRNAIEYGMNLTQSPQLSLNDLPKAISDPFGRQTAITGAASFSLRNINKDNQKYEAKLIMDLLTRFNGNKSKVSAELGISRPALYRRLQKLGIETED